MQHLTAEQIQQEAERRWPFGLEERITTEIRHSAFRACTTWMQEQQQSHPSPDKTAEEIYVCKIKVLGFPFAVLTESEAKAWVDEDPQSNYYEKIQIKKTC